MIWRATAVIALSIAGFVPAGRAVAAAQCGPAEAILQALHDQYGEVPAFTGIANGLVVTILVGPTGSWTVLGREGDVICLLASGDHWTPKLADNVPAPLPQATLPTPALLPHHMLRI